jgi:NADPH:quinone reductase-like Zn-dependent oxidoreductase
MTTAGGYPGTPAPPFVAGREFAGVEETTGRRVMGYVQWGAFAEKIVPKSELYGRYRNLGPTSRQRHFR